MHGRGPAGASTAIATIALAVAAAVHASAPPPAAAAPAAATAGATRVERALVAEMNRVRARFGRGPLRPIATLTRPARAHSRYLLSSGALSHEDSDGAPFWVRLVAAGFPRNRAMGENLAMTAGCTAATARRTVRIWMASPGHQANLLNPAFRWTGAGVAATSDCSTTIITADYGS